MSPTSEIPLTLKTANLRLQLNSPRNFPAMVEGVAQYEAELGLKAAPGLRAFFVTGDISPAWLEMLRNTPAADPWVHGFVVIHQADNLVIGSAGFKGPPNEEGVVEIAYGIVPSYQRRGYATEAAAALVQFAGSDARVKRTSAHTLPTGAASMRVLEKCGFARVGEFIDPEDGLVVRWELV